MSHGNVPRILHEHIFAPVSRMHNLVNLDKPKLLRALAPQEFVTSSRFLIS